MCVCVCVRVVQSLRATRVVCDAAEAQLLRGLQPLGVLLHHVAEIGATEDGQLERGPLWNSCELVKVSKEAEQRLVGTDVDTW